MYDYEIASRIAQCNLDNPTGMLLHTPAPPLHMGPLCTGNPIYVETCVTWNSLYRGSPHPASDIWWPRLGPVQTCSLEDLSPPLLTSGGY